MLSYQHGYHAGNMADVQKHALLAWVLDYMIRKDKPLSYIESHAGRGLYDLESAESIKTGEAAKGIALARAKGWFAPDHPYLAALDRVRAEYGPAAYPGSPMVAASVLRDEDVMRLAELHPQEHAVLNEVLGLRATVVKRNGVEFTRSICPPDPKRGVLLVDPPYEVKDDYQTMAALLPQIHRKWNVGVLLLWYPILTDGLHKPMLAALQRALPEGHRHEVAFPPARQGHRMIGSGMFAVNAPYGYAEEAARLSALFNALS